MISIPEELQDYLELQPGPTLRGGRYGKHVTHFPSRKNRRSIACESILEADFCLELERAPYIASYEAQPFSLVLKGKKKRYTPDFAAQLTDGSIVIYEVKTDISALEPLTHERLRFYQEQIALCGSFLECVLASQFQHPIRTQNLRQLYHQSFGVEKCKSTELLNYTNNKSNCKLKVQDLLIAGFTPSDIAYAVFYSHFIADLKKPFSLETVLDFRRVETYENN